MYLTNIVKNELKKIVKEKGIENFIVEIEKPRDEKFGDYSTSIAMKLAKELKKAPRSIAEELVEELSKNEVFEKVEIAGPGFINFYLKNEITLEVLKKVLEEKEQFGSSSFGEGKKVMVEYVSANPTGYLHVGHARGAVVGDVLSNILKFAGFDVSKEYYINDAGSQMDKLSKSVYLRYLELLGEEVEFIEDGYKGEYIYDIAREIKNEYGESKRGEFGEVEPFFKAESLKWCTHEIKKDLELFGIEFDSWYSEQTLYDTEKVWKSIKELEEKEFIYTKDDAKWFRTTDFGDDKDRVVLRADGTPTYYASDIAYHEDKMNRGFEKLIDVWGADHHGYVARVKAALSALGYDKDVLGVILVQIVSLFKNGKPFVMSKRTGNFITIRELVEEVGKDVARLYFVMRSSDSQFDFDLEAAKEQSSDNPAYYIQYAYARICSIIEKSEIQLDKLKVYKLDLIKEKEELRIIKKIDEFEDVVNLIAKNNEVHRLIKYAQELAGLVHSFYNKHRVLSDEKDLMIQRLLLLDGVKIVIKNVLGLIGVEAPEKM